MADPAEYHKFDKLNLYFKDVKDCSLDEAGAEKYKKDKTKANVSGTYVQQAQKDLIALGYLPEKSEKGDDNADGYYGRGTARAVLRFQRHAARVYRMDSSKAVQDAKEDEVFKGEANGICDQDTSKEIRKWIDKKWINPVGRFKLQSLKSHLGGKLREDAATAWEEIAELAEKNGGILIGPYGDTKRVLRKTDKGGTSPYSLHYFGRAVDICQDLANPHGILFEHVGYAPEKKEDETADQVKERQGKEKTQAEYASIDKLNAAHFTKEINHSKHGKIKATGKRYFVVKDPSGSDTYWRIFCWCSLQDGTQGEEIKKGGKKWWDFSSKKEENFPAGWYLDLTELIASTGKFERIPAQENWETNYNKSEWWHFKFGGGLQETFVDEAELIGVTEKEVIEAGWKTDAERDARPR